MASKSKAWKALWPTALVLILLALLTGGWFWAKQYAETGFAEQAAMKDSTTALTCSRSTWSGYPFKLQLDCADPTIHLDRGQTLLRPRKLTGYVLASSLRTVLVHMDGPTLLLNPNQADEITIQHQPATIRIQIQTTSTIASDTKISAIDVQQSDKTLATIDQLRLQTTFNTENQRNIELKLQLSNFKLNVAATDPVILQDADTTIQVRNAPREPAPNALEWMKAAASQATMFDIKNFQAQSGATRLTAEGTFKIEELGTIDGSLKTRVTDLDTMLDDLKKRQVLTPKNAQAASALLGMFDKGDGVAADLQFKKQKIYWGPLQLGVQTPLF